LKARAFSSSRRRVCAAGALLPAWASLAPAWAQDDIAVAEFFKAPAISGLRLAPDGRRIAGIRDVGGRLNVTVVDVATRKASVITNFRDADVAGLGWIDATRLLFSLVDRSRGSGDQAPGGLFVVDADGSSFRSLVERSGLSEGGRQLPVGSSFHGRIFEDGKWSTDILVLVPSMQAQGRFSSNVYRVNTSSGQSTLMTLGGPGNAVDWVFDRNVVARVALSQADGNSRLHYRDDAQQPWRMLLEVKRDEILRTVRPLAFDAKGHLYVSAYAGKDNAAIHRFDPKTASVDAEPVFAVKGFDVEGGLVFSSDGARLLGIRYDADRERTYWLDSKLSALQARIDATLPDTLNVLQAADLDAGGAVSLVAAYSDRDPGRYYLFDGDKKQIEQIASQRPWIKPAEMSPTRFFDYAARDGLTIPAQLTIPLRKRAGKTPLVVLHYGGPWVRPVEWRWDPVVQFLASRGYAVFMPAPRASRGFGARLFMAGWRQWGLAMQDDVTDGVRKLIADGLVDGDRVCIAGASYGGYLAMMGLVKEPDLYKCAVNWVGVTDPSFMFTVTWTDFNRVDSGRYDLPMLVGDPDKDQEQFRRTSPVERAAEIRQPVLMAYGGLDQRVPVVNGERMRSALAPHNRNVQWIVYPDEGHGWLRLEDNIDFWTRVEKFLAASLPG
jgi:dipeptidyl aminopeptidase/acylaminoacyl peptidase